MPNFYQLLLSIVGHVPGTRASRLTHAASLTANPRKRPKRRRKGQAPPFFAGDNRLRRDIGLPPLDRHGLPM
jgi:hypothetical protein